MGLTQSQISFFFLLHKYCVGFVILQSIFVFTFRRDSLLDTERS